MATLDDVMTRLPVAPQPLGLEIDGDPRKAPDSSNYQIGLRNRHGKRGTRVVLQLTTELVDDAEDVIEVVSVVERSGVLTMLAAAQTSRTLGVMSNGKVFEVA